MSGRLNLTGPHPWTLVAIVWTLIAILAGIVVHRILLWALRGLAARHDSRLLAAVLNRLSRPSAYILPLLAILAVFPNIVIPAAWKPPVVHLAEILAIGAAA